MRLSQRIGRKKGVEFTNIKYDVSSNFCFFFCGLCAFSRPGFLPPRNYSIGLWPLVVVRDLAVSPEVRAEGRAAVNADSGRVARARALHEGVGLVSRRRGHEGAEHRVRGCLAARLAAEQAIKAAQQMGLQEVDLVIKGPGPGRESAIRAVQSMGIKVRSILDKTPVAHNGCRPPKKRRV